MRPRFRMHVALIVMAFSTILPARPGFAQEPAPRPDSQIQALITHQLNEKHISKVQVAVSGGVVTLDGMVQSAWEKEEAIDIAHKTHDVQKVVSTLRVARAESDKTIADKIAAQVLRYVFYTVFDNIGLSVENGVVTLTGQVTAPFKANEIANLASRVQGVQAVKNQIEVLPTSPFDDQLRQSIASQIYRDPTFFNYSIQPNPPIHVIVNGGKVTLTGVVNSQIEKQKAEIIARNTFGVFSVDNQIRVERGPSD